MPTVNVILTDVLAEIGVLQASETPEAGDMQLALRYLQRQIDAWQAERLTLAAQLRTSFPWPANTSTVTLGASGAIVTMVRPVWINTVAYVIPGSSPACEVGIAQLDEDGYARLSMKALPSALPTQSWYQVRVDGVLGDLFLWPQVTQGVTIVIYTPEAVGVPVSLNTVLTAPAGYAEGFHYQLALRLCRPFGIAVTPDLQDLATKAFATMKRPNVKPGLLGMDAAVIPTAGGYNVLTDNSGSW